MADQPPPAVEGAPKASRVRLVIRQLAGLFTRAKFPAWAVILWEAFQGIPDWKSRVDFWVDVAKGTGGFWGGVATVISLPYFNLTLTAAALVWLGIAGEPKKGVQRHPWLPYLGWAVFGIVLSAIGSAVITGYFEFKIKSEVSSRDTELQKQYAARPVYWHLTDAQRTALGFELDQIPEDRRFEIKVKCLPDAGSRTFVEDIGKIFIDHKWKLTANCFFTTIRPDLTGLYIAIPKNLNNKKTEELPKNLQTLVHVLDSAKIPGAYATDETLPDGEDFYLAIGNAP